MRRSSLLIAMSLSCSLSLSLLFGAACSGDDAPDLTGRWELPMSRDAYEFFADDRFVVEIEAQDGIITREGTYATSGGQLTLSYDGDHSSPGSLRRATMSVWTDGDTLEMAFAAPDHDGDAIVGTWRSTLTLEVTDLDDVEAVEEQVLEVVTTFEDDGTVSEDFFVNGLDGEPLTGIYTVAGGAVDITWDGELTDRRYLSDRRMGTPAFVRAE